MNHGAIRWSVLLAGCAVLAAGTRQRLKNWGASPQEVKATLPGDELVPTPATTATRAVTIEAPAAEVWKWLVQIGKGRGGMYSYDWLENIIGLNIHSANEIREELQHLAIGDRIVVVPSGWMGMKAGYSFPVARVDDGHSIVLRQAPPEHPWDGVWSFVIAPAGSERCRLISRSRTRRRAGLGGHILEVASEIGDPITLLMTRKMFARHQGASRTQLPSDFPRMIRRHGRPM